MPMEEDYKEGWEGGEGIYWKRRARGIRDRDARHALKARGKVGD
jgi:hypothetical protein